MELHHADCFDVFPDIPDNSIDLVCVDLPYGVTNCDWDVSIDLEKMWKQLLRVGKKNTAYVFFGSFKFGMMLALSNPKMFRYDLVWQKSRSAGFLSAKKMPLRSHECLYIFYKNLPIYNPQFTFGHKPYNHDISGVIASVYGTKGRVRNISDGRRYPLSVLQFASEKKAVHATQKPVGLLEWIVKTYSNENDTVLDFTMGSGTTAVACKNTNRKFIGVERDEKIFEVAKKRIDT